MSDLTRDEILAKLKQTARATKPKDLIDARQLINPSGRLSELANDLHIFDQLG